MSASFSSPHIRALLKNAGAGCGADMIEFDGKTINDLAALVVDNLTVNNNLAATGNLTGANVAAVGAVTGANLQSANNTPVGADLVRRDLFGELAFKNGAGVTPGEFERATVTVNADGLVTGISEGAAQDISGQLAPLSNNILYLHYLQDATFHEFLDGFSDGFEDESGVDTTSSVNQDYDADGDFCCPDRQVSEEYTFSEGNSLYANPIGNPTGVIKYAQSFTTSVSGIHDKVKLYVCKAGTPTGTAQVSIYASDEDSYPTGSPLAGGTFDVSALNTTGVLKEIEFSEGAYLTSGNKYCVVLEYAGGDSSNYLSWQSGSGDATQSDSTKYHGTTEVWSNHGSAFCLRVFANVALNMTLLSEAVEALAEPTDARAMICLDTNGVIGTDVKLFFSKDEGSTFEEITLTEVGALDADKIIYVGTEELTTVSDKTIILKAQSFNNVECDVHFWGVSWK